ncbi:MAG TPA: sodium:proton antiporter [Polyangia bacterium]|nr:sodium:proton antiporter [Polyangia bacterium]
MSAFNALSLLIVLAAVFSFLNHRLLHLPTTIGVTLLVMVASLVLMVAGAAGLPVHALATAFVERLSFSELVLNGMLAFLLFAGALNLAVDLDELVGQRWAIGVLATVGVVASTFLVGGLTWALTGWFGGQLTIVECLLFGAIISPTDPISVLAMLRSTSAPKAIQVQMAGEALFNDGIGVVTFSIILGLMGAAGATGHVDAGTVAVLLGKQVVGSLAVGFGAGWLAILMLRSVDNYQVEILLTLGLASGLYSLATALDMSGPLAVVVAGLLVGGPGRAHAMSARTLQHLDTFWELIDEALNVVLFVLIGFQVLVVRFTGTLLLIGLIAAAFVLVARFLSVGATVVAMKRLVSFQPHAVKILTWGGLRGGLSLAMALSLGPQIAGRQTIQAITYVVAVFSIVVQGVTFGRLIRVTDSATKR